MVTDGDNDENIAKSEQLTKCDKLTTYTADGPHTIARHMNRIKKDVDVHTHGETTRAKQSKIPKATHTGRITETDLEDAHASKNSYKASKTTKIKRID
jgi:hypothetical protein